MTRKKVAEYVIPKCQGITFEVNADQVLRLTEIEGPQAADLIVFNSKDLSETSSIWLSRQISGSFTRIKELYSKLPWGNVMFKILTDLPGVFWLSPGRCNKMYYKVRYGIEGYHENCQDILADCVRERGIGEYQLPDVFNIFMNAKFSPDGRVKLLQSPVRKGDFVDMQAEMDCLVAICACPDDLGAYNGKVTKSLGVEIQE